MSKYWNDRLWHLMLLMLLLLLFFSGRFKCDIIRVFQLVFCFFKYIWGRGSCAVCHYDLLHAFPRLSCIQHHKHNLQSVDSLKKWLCHLNYCNFAFQRRIWKKKNSNWSCLYLLLRYNILCVILIHFCSRKKSRSTCPFFLTHPICIPQHLENKYV